MNIGRLIIKFYGGPLLDKTFSLGENEEIIIGKDDDCQIKVDGDPLVSRKHARIYFENGIPYFEDLNSTNGSFLGTRRIKKTIQIKPGKRITLGRLTTFEAGFWNALEPSRFASLAIVTQPSIAMVQFHGKIKKRFWARFSKVFVFLCITATVGFLIWKPETLSNLFHPPRIARIKPTYPRFTAKTRVEPNSVSAPTSNTEIKQNFVWDEIVNISRRFGDVPPSAMDVEFLSQVERWIERYTKNDGHKKILAHYEQYKPMINTAFETQNLPTELGMVAFVESGFETNLKSPAGALGMWQFIPSSAQSFGLEVSETTDERLDPEKSSKAAAMYFSLLLKMFGTDRYLLAVAAYNAGQNKIKRQEIARTIRKAKKPDFWHLKDDLPSETIAYVPKVLAAIIIERNQERW